MLLQYPTSAAKAHSHLSFFLSISHLYPSLSIPPSVSALALISPLSLFHHTLASFLFSLALSFSPSLFSSLSLHLYLGSWFCVHELIKPLREHERRQRKSGEGNQGHKERETKKSLFTGSCQILLRLQM